MHFNIKYFRSYNLATSSLRMLMFCSLIITFSKCNSNKPELPLFELITGDKTGLNFNNEPPIDTKINIFKYMYYYNGGGLGSGDFNNDGLIDLFFTANNKENKLFLNRGNLSFEDVTVQTGITSDLAWSNGVSVVDINNDGMLDLYISQVGDFLMFKGHNLLYVCTGIENGIPKYDEKSKEYGLDLVGFGTQAVFFDYDLDGDLDMFQLNHSVHANGTFGEKVSFEGTYHDKSGDRLFRNDNGKYIEVTKTSGIYSTVIGYGLGVVASDINQDGWPDLYVGNDFHEDDYYYINQKNGTFKEVLRDQIMHTSKFSMGVDAPDLNGDGYNEIISLDMLPQDPLILKKSEGEEPIDLYNFKVDYGYGYQYSRNNLQLNNGNGTFSEIGQYSGVHATDWSWSPLFFDMDGDGKKDLFISNGIPKRMNDLDYINFVENPDWQWKTRMGDLSTNELSILDKVPEIKLPNKFYIQGNDLKFIDSKLRVINDLPSYSNSAIYADLDNDGDLDVVTNNINDLPFVYKNLSNDDGKGSLLKLDLEGPKGNVRAIGSKVIVSSVAGQSYLEKYVVKGFQSSMEGPLIVHLPSSHLDSVIVVWPDQTYQKLSLTTEKSIKVVYKEGLPKYQFPSEGEAPRFKDVTKTLGIDWIHEENPFVEFNREQLIPHTTGDGGPGVAVGDLNGDGLEDIFFGSSKTFWSEVYFQTEDGKFQKQFIPALRQDSMYEVVDALIIDIDGDQDNDLIIAEGGNEWRSNSPYLAPRVYLNDGKGNLTLKLDAFENVSCSASRIISADYDGDGDLDLFLAARSLPWSYGLNPQSYLLNNDGKGKFTDVTERDAKGLAHLGLIKDALWYDMDGNQTLDLVVAVEWDGIYFYNNDGKTLASTKLTSVNGFWNKVYPMDFNKDGKMDLFVGNYGQNNKFNPTPQRPVTMFINDFDDNETQEQIITYYNEGQEILFATKAELQKQLPYLKKKYLMAGDFAKAKVNEMFDSHKMKSAVIKTFDYPDNAILYNQGKGNYTLTSLPSNFQYTPYTSFMPMGDSSQEALIAGNFFWF